MQEIGGSASRSIVMTVKLVCNVAFFCSEGQVKLDSYGTFDNMNVISMAF